MWLCGYVAIWLCGKVSRFGISTFPIFRLSHFERSISKFTFQVSISPFSNFKLCQLANAQVLQNNKLSAFSNCEISNKKSVVHGVSRSFRFSESHIYKNNICQNVSRIRLHFLKYLGYLKPINKDSLGVKNPEIMEMLGFGPSHNRIAI